MNKPLQSWLIVLLALGAPAWCCGMPRALAGDRPMACHKNAGETDPAPGEKDHCPSHPQPQSPQPQQPEKPADNCDCPSPDAVAVPATGSPHIGAVLGDAPQMPSVLALLPFDPAPRIAAQPFRVARGMPPPRTSRARLTRLCVFIL